MGKGICKGEKGGGQAEREWGRGAREQGAGGEGGRKG